LLVTVCNPVKSESYESWATTMCCASGYEKLDSYLPVEESGSGPGIKKARKWVKWTAGPEDLYIS